MIVWIVSMETSMANVTEKLPMTGSSLGIFLGENPLHLALPLLCMQMFVVVTFTRLLAFLLTPLRQPRVIAEIIGGILLGPSGLWCGKVFVDTMFPNESLRTLDLLSNFGYLLFLFRVGLELDLASFCRTGKRSLAIAVAGISAPFILGIGTSQVLSQSITPKALEPIFLIFMGVNLSVTAFPILPRILNELELLNTELGQMALSIAVVHDIAAWILLVLSPPGHTGYYSLIMSFCVLLSRILLITGVAVILRLAINWMMTLPHFQGGEEAYICTMLVFVLIASFVTDAIGINALFGAFVVGILVPKEGPFASVLIKKVDYFISISLLLPLYFVSGGQKTNITAITSGGISWGSLSIMISSGFLGKIGGTIVASIALKIPFREAVTLGLLVNTKGIVEQIVQSMGKDDKAVLDEEAFSIMVLLVLFVMFITMPIMMQVYKPVRKMAAYKQRRMEGKDAESKLRVLACYHDNRSRPTIMTLMESSRGNGRCKLTAQALVLMMLDDDSSTTSVARKIHHVGNPIWKSKLGNNIPPDGVVYQIVCDFRAHQQFSDTLLHGLHDFLYQDVVARAQQKRVALIILPYHQSVQINGSMVPVNSRFQEMNRRVLLETPCSVAILVDRGLGCSEDMISYSVSALFFGGCDDREALAYGLHIAGYPGIDLTVTRFISLPDGPVNYDKWNAAGMEMQVKQSSEDDECIARLLETVATDKNVSVKFEEKVVGGKEVILSTINDAVRCRLFLVGQRAPVMPLVADGTNCWELGPMGTYLAFPHSTTASVLVFRQKVSFQTAASLIKGKERRSGLG